ncbi:hypothetical protein ACVMB0_007031 [Bradyrhizobium sp. USDA 4451]
MVSKGLTGWVTFEGGGLGPAASSWHRHPRAKASPLSLEVRAERASKDERPGWWPSILRDAASRLLRMTEHKFAFSRHICPSFACRFALSLKRAQGKPGADRTHGPRAMGRKHGGRTTGVTGNNPAFPARWVTAYTCSPRRDLACLSPSSQRAFAQSEETPTARASGLHDFAVRFMRIRRLHNRRPPHLDPRS